MVLSVLLALKSMGQENHEFQNRLGLKKKNPKFKFDRCHDSSCVCGQTPAQKQLKGGRVDLGYSLKVCCPWWQEERATGACGSWSHCTCMHSGSRHPQEVEWGPITNRQLSSASFLKRGSTHYLKVSSLLKQCCQLRTTGQTDAYAGQFTPNYNSPHQWHHLGLKCFLRKDCELYVPFDCHRALRVVSPFFSLLWNFLKLYLGWKGG